jgi:hypothetical protein
MVMAGQCLLVEKLQWPIGHHFRRLMVDWKAQKEKKIQVH